MKQRITINQFNELSDEQKGRLREWISEDEPLLSIGQMIELIGEKLDRISSPYGNESHIEPGQWKVWMITGGFWDGETEELADALWEAVKESLEG